MYFHSVQRKYNQYKVTQRSVFDFNMINYGIVQTMYYYNKPCHVIVIKEKVLIKQQYS